MSSLFHRHFFWKNEGKCRGFSSIQIKNGKNVWCSIFIPSVVTFRNEIPQKVFLFLGFVSIWESIFRITKILLRKNYGFFNVFFWVLFRNERIKGISSFLREKYRNNKNNKKIKILLIRWIDFLFLDIQINSWKKLFLGYLQATNKK